MTVDGDTAREALEAAMDDVLYLRESANPRMAHDCERERRRVAAEAERLTALLTTALQPSSPKAKRPGSRSGTKQP